MVYSNSGLCDRCIHQQLVPNTRGSVFSLCRRSREDPAYPRYPRVPVLECPGYEPPPPSADRPEDNGDSQNAPSADR